jgi:hypothetical protein
VLAIDTAEHSGWAILVEGELFDSGEVHMLRQAAEVRRVCERLRSVQSCEDLPMLLVLEAPFGGLNQGQYRGAWRMAYAEAGGRLVVQVQPSVWRKGVLGFTHPRELVRQAERTRVLQDVARVHRRAPGPDEAPAICIGYWATYAAEVGRKLRPRSP